MRIMFEGLAYLFIVFFLLRFFLLVHRWDEEIRRMAIPEESGSKPNDRESGSPVVQARPRAWAETSHRTK